MLKDAGERTGHDVMRARLALALVSKRAHECPLKACGRKRRCLAGFGPPDFNLNGRLGNCPNMSEAEWRIVRLGLGRARDAIERAYRHRDAAFEAEIDALPKEDRDMLRADLEAARERLEAQRAKKPERMTYFNWLWMERDGWRIAARPDVAAADAEVIAWWRERGVTSALEAEDG